MSKRTTMKDIAEKLGVSVATVHRAFSESGNEILPETREKILKLSRDLNYTPNLLARSLVCKQSHNIGVVLWNISDPMLEDLVKNLEKGLADAGYDISIAISHADPDIEKRIVKGQLRRMCDGVILHCGTFNKSNKAIDFLIERKIPLVVLGEYHQKAVSSVSLNMKLAGRDITEYILDKGHSRVGAVYSVDGDTRVDGYKEAFETRGLKVDESLILKVDYSFRESCFLAKKIKELGMTAVFATTDRLATGVLKSLRMIGMNIPDDMSVATCGDNFFTGALWPPLTTYTWDADISSYLKELILERILKPDGPLRNILLSGRLIIRNSVLALPS